MPLLHSYVKFALSCGRGTCFLFCFGCRGERLSALTQPKINLLRTRARHRRGLAPTSTVRQVRCRAPAAWVSAISCVTIHDQCPLPQCPRPTFFYSFNVTNRSSGSFTRCPPIPSRRAQREPLNRTSLRRRSSTRSPRYASPLSPSSSCLP